MINFIHNSEELGVTFFEGLDFKKCIEFNNRWSSALGKLIDHLFTENSVKTREEAINCLIENGFQDFHWNWQSKAMLYAESNYMWFTAEDDQEVEGVIIANHPVTALEDQTQIFYIEYLCVAPWNRIEGVIERDRKRGVGKELIKVAASRMSEEHGYRQGFSLHSLSQSQSYYERLGMISYGEDKEKENLVYFEMPESNAQEFLS